MGLLPCHLSCHRDDDESKPGSNHLHSDSSSSSSSISSQPSLPSVPSLTSPSQRHEHTSTIHHKCIATLRSCSYVCSLALAAKILYSGYSNGEIRAWSQDSCEQDDPIDNIVATTNSAVKSLVVVGDRLFSAHQDNKIRVWRIHSNLQQRYKCIATLPTLNDRFIRCFSEKNYVQVRRHKKSTWVHHVDAVSALAISTDSSLLYSASWDRSFKVWRTSDFKCMESVQNAHEDAINAIVLSKEGYVYTGSADKTIKVWKKHAGETKHVLVATLEKHKSAVNALALSNDGTVLYSGACDRSILVWERDGGGGGGGDRHMVLVGALRGHTKAILCLAVAADFICSGSADKTVRIWRRGSDKTYSCLAVLEGHRKPVKCLTTAVDAKTNTHMVCSGSLDYDIKVLQVLDPVL